MSIALQLDKPRLAEFCRQNHIISLALFGSVLRNDFRPDSDVDVLVVFAPGKTVGFGIFRLEEQLSVLFDDHKIDLISQKYLNPRIRDRILASAEIQYAEG